MAQSIALLQVNTGLTLLIFIAHHTTKRILNG
ncbi:hypothetical protein HD_0567 [[Haemophilus] ducreyi 35000HP]|uniref:Uncharacterized protein n=1 Tax=Haemophilus ducreyi (strain 35000HP / ATCC 700724) TaxID=233412 RepID=Q7VNG9_HAEDU|nr:hypothetical protein HD_0567 [[Haemophilus] ducreyi 35000HP]